MKSAEPLEPAGALHEPQNGTDSPGSQPLSVQLEGEKCRPLSQHIEPNNVKMARVCRWSKKSSRKGEAREAIGGQRDERARESVAPSSNGENTIPDSTPPPSTASCHAMNDNTMVTLHRCAEWSQ
ncbi:hypothetical protein PAXRUDRAFT_166138 [Paxillus rubicundulus Ve08.2h10]|uniref:Uncharacterized protein n=1 Tax=Paxillus rubicundulus Ve08.2h10 TaxID=930991 RepID=A0A0D0DAS0_9AGAM|nr:hypothetical protein PAXRUDRAFT_166138 [Paxillus rubicundulus Ve08.2h10]